MVLHGFGFTAMFSMLVLVHSTPVVSRNGLEFTQQPNNFAINLGLVYLQPDAYRRGQMGHVALGSVIARARGSLGKQDLYGGTCHSGGRDKAL